MPWLEFSVHLARSETEAVEEFLIAQGALAVTIQDLEDQPILEPEPGTTPIWDNNKITGLFENSQLDAELLFSRLKDLLGNRAPGHFLVNALEDRDWEREWLKHYRSMCFGDRLWIVPGIFQEQQNSLPEGIKETDTILHMDPGMAFGTGTHETTALCLEWLARNPPENTVMIDYGCGSGILAIAGALLGAREVYGCDIDPQAIIASNENARRNRIKSGFHAGSVNELKSLFGKRPEKADLLMANILAGPLEKLKQELANLVESNGIIVLSGILADQADRLVQHYQNLFRDFELEEKNGWVRITATRI